MKNTFRLFAAIAVCIMLFASCKKEPTPTPEPTIETGLEGQFMPERKIASIVRFNLVGDSLSPLVQNYYEWDGDLLSKITQTQFGGSFVFSQTIHYDSLNRIAKIDDVRSIEENNTYLEYIYEGKELAKVNRYKGNGELLEEYTFIRTDGKVTEVQKYHYTETTAEYSFKTIVWEGDNIIQIAINENGGTVPTDYTFDDKINPLYGLYDDGFYSSLAVVFSANNVLTSTMVMDYGGINLTTTSTYDYEYDDKGYPVKETCVKNLGTVNSTIVSNFTYLE